jgi:hypothetical protein
MMMKQVLSQILQVRTLFEPKFFIFVNIFLLNSATQRYGMHESYDYYQLCQRTQRNKGLYTADQQVNRDDRRGTRQNPNGNRHGFECPEERDYYPWWAPSPWIDIAVLTDSAADTPCTPTTVNQCSLRCQYYMNNTMNFNPKGYCDVAHNGSQPLTKKINSQAWNNRQWYNNELACKKAGFHWFEVSHADNLNFDHATNFICAKTQFSRVNQLGNALAPTVVSQNAAVGVTATHVTENLNANRFLWTVPHIPTPKNASYFKPNVASAYKSCTLRIRYNVSSADFQQWPKDAVNPGTPRMVDHFNNSRTSTDPRSPLHQDPYVVIGPGADATKTQQFVKLKVNTNQYGRTFQDRSYVFSIKPLPTSTQAASNQADVPAIDVAAVNNAITNGGKIYNVNVRGKRGNIVQVNRFVSPVSMKHFSFSLFIILRCILQWNTTLFPMLSPLVSMIWCTSNGLDLIIILNEVVMMLPVVLLIQMIIKRPQMRISTLVRIVRTSSLLTTWEIMCLRIIWVIIRMRI